MVRLNPRTQCMSDNENAERLKAEIKGYLDSIHAKYDENNIGKVTKIIITCIDDNYGKNSAKIAEGFFACGFVPINNFNRTDGYKMIYVNDEAMPVINANISLWFIEKEVRIKQDKRLLKLHLEGLNLCTI